MVKEYEEGYLCPFEFSMGCRKQNAKNRKQMQ